MADYPHLNGWQGWLEKYRYPDRDPFLRPVPAPVAGIFDTTTGELRTVQFNSAWSPVITGALSRLELPELYLTDGETQVQEIRKLINYIAGLETLELPQPTETTCTYYPSYYAGIEYIPHNPFDGQSTFDPQYPVAPFFRFGRIETILPNWLEDFFLNTIEWATGYRENDVFVSYLSLPTLTNPFDGLDYPTIKLTVQGSGKVSLTMLSVPAGGRALISLDPPDIGDLFNALWSPDDAIIELNRDILSLPPETDLDTIEEIVLPDDGTHTIYITFLPTINDEAPFLQMGGGFRGYELCGSLTVIDPVTGLPIDFSNPDGAYQNGVIMTTQDDLYNALLRYENQRAMRWLSAQSGNISAGIDISPDSSNLDGLSFSVDNSASVDTDNITAQSQEIIYGGAYGVGAGFADIIGQIVLNQQNAFTIERIVNRARTAFGIAEAIVNPDQTITDKFFDALNLTLANALDVVAPVVNPLSIADLVFCDVLAGKGVTKRALYQYSYNIEDGGGQDAEDIALFYRSVIDNLTDQQLVEWYQAGTSAPRSEYFNAPCARFTTFDYTYNQTMAQSNSIVQPQHENIVSKPRLVRITAQGVMTDSTGRKRDIAFSIATDGATTRTDFNKLVFRTSTNNSVGTFYPPQNIAYDEGGKYSWTVEVPAGTARHEYQIGGTNLDLATVTGDIKFTYQDLGAV